MQNKALAKFSLLLISIFLMSHLAIAPAIPSLYDFYHGLNPKIGLASVESLATAPAMMITIFVLVSNLVVRFLSKKNTVLLGLAMITVFGVLPVFLTDFKLVFICRLLLGVGIGLYNSLSISMIVDLYEGPTQAQMIGLRTAFLNLGKALTTLIAGLALGIGINYTFGVYILALPVLILFAVFVPQTEAKEAKLTQVVVFNKTALLLIALTFLIGISYIGATIKIPSLLETKYGFEPALSNKFLTLLAFSGIITGCFFGPIVKKLGNATLYILLAALGLGNLLFVLPLNFPLFIVGAILVGMAFVGIMSFNFYYIARHFKKEQVNFVTSMVITSGNIGVVLTPVFLTKLLQKFQIEVFVTPFYISAGLMLIACGLAYLLLKDEK